MTRAQQLMLGLGGLTAATFVVLPSSVLLELVLYNGTLAVVLVVAITAARRIDPARRLPWLLNAVSIGLFLCGELIWWWYLAQGDDPFPSIADAFYPLAYLPLCGAAYLLARGGAGERDRSGWIDASVLTVAIGVVIWVTIMQPYVGDAESTWLEKAISLLYPLADVLAIGFVLRLLFTRSARSQAAMLFATGVLITFAADVVFAWLDLRDLYEPASFVDGLWLVSFVFLGAAPLDRSAGRIAAPTADTALGRGRLLAVLASLALPLAVLFFGIQRAEGIGVTTTTVAACAATAIMALVSIRMWLLLGQARRLEARRGSDRLSAVIHHSTDAIVLVDAEGVVSYASPSAQVVACRPEVDTVGSNITSWFTGDDGPTVMRLIGGLALAPVETTIELGSRRILGQGGIELRTVEGRARNLLADPSVGAIVVTLWDVTRQRELEAQLERRAFHDELTDLPNRALFTDRVGHALDRLGRSTPLAMAALFIDLDDFKAVNDGMGHGAGDELLRGVATRIRSCLRPADTVARLGGDEFAVLLEDLTGIDEAMATAQRVLEMLALPMRVSATDIAVGASVGVAPATAESTVSSLLRDADIAMYSAKSKGKGRVEVFDDSLRRRAEEHLVLRIELPRALESGQFHLVYQPIFEARGGGLVGFEALVRWEHPERGVVSPMDFIPAAEDSGLIVPLGRWVLGEACRQAAVWNREAAAPLAMNVNVSGVQLQQPEFVDEVRRALASTGLAPELLVLELTESVLIDYERIGPVLHGLRATGAGIAIDDFGTGYSSLSYLQHFPVTCVKIDRAFVAELGRTGDSGVVRSILAIAEALSLKTVAEGVETADQLAMLGALDCTYAQGYYLGKPSTVEHVEQRLPRPVAR